MHPAAPMVARVLDADVATSPGGPVLRAGSAAAVWIHAVHRDRAAWVRARARCAVSWLASPASLSPCVVAWHHLQSSVVCFRC